MQRTSKALVLGLLCMGTEAVHASPSLAQTVLGNLKYDPRTREIVLEAKGPITPLSSYHPELAAWVIDFRNARYRGKVHLAGAPDGPIAGLLINQLNKKWVRMAFHLDGTHGSPFSSWRMVGKTYRVKLRAPEPRLAMPAETPIGSYREAYSVPPFEGASVRRTEDATWRWRSMSQMLLSSNIAHFSRGPSLAGARLSYQGTHRSYQPLARGYLLGHIEQQTLRFAEPRYDYGSLVGSLALSHPLTPWLHAFEGGAMLVSQANTFQALNFLDTDLFTGVGTFAAGPAGLWYGTLTAERMTARALRNSYYGQTLRLGYQLEVASTDVQLQATMQRVDPMILSPSTYRAFAYSALERELSPGVRIGVRGLMGTQRSPESFSWFTEGGPYLQASF